MAPRSWALGTSKYQMPRLKRRWSSGGNVSRRLAVARNSTSLPPTAPMMSIMVRMRRSDSPTRDARAAPRSPTSVRTWNVLPVQTEERVLPVPGAPTRMVPSQLLSCMLVSRTLSMSWLTPVLSAMVPEAADETLLSISSQRTTRRGRRGPENSPCRNCLKLAWPPMSSKVSVPRS